MNDKKLIRYGAPIAAFAAVYFNMLNGDWSTFGAGLVAAWAFFEYR